jgi:DNA-binding CsgD family transcriptional regulator
MCRSVLAWVSAVRGDQESCRDHAQHVLGAASQAAIRPAAGGAMWALGLLDLGMGRPQQALDQLHRLAVALPAYSVLPHATGDAVEAAVRAGRPELGEDVLNGGRPALARLAERTGQPWVLAITARCRALLAGQSAQAEEHFREAARWHAQATRPFERARTDLLYVEWLRRARRPTDAREHLRAALDTFGALRAAPWAERAQGELRAAGETVTHRPTGGHGRLTPREIQITRMVSGGATNREIAAQLFLSPRTIDYYLHKIFAKLGVRSRVELARLGYGDDSSAGPSS